MAQSDLMLQIWRILGSAPYLFVVLGGVALCLARAPRMPRTALIVGMALGIEIVGFVVLPMITSQLFARWPADSTDQLGMRILVNSLVYAIPSSISLSLLLWAAFWPQTSSSTADVRQP